MNYTDLITYCPDTTALMDEVAQVAPDRIIKDENDQPVGFSITKTPTVRKGNETLAVVRVNDADLALIESLTTLQILAKVPAGGDLLAALNADPEARAIYDRVYPRTPVDVVDEAGNVIGAWTPPELVGVFA